MPDSRTHRGAHPEDDRLFAADAWPSLRAATVDLSWLLSRGYAATSATKLVGDRYQLDRRQRVAVCRCACSDKDRENRQRCQVAFGESRGEEVWLDGYNVLTSVEAALGGGVILLARDGCFRDMASMHGSYRKVAETLPAIRILGRAVEELGFDVCRWYLDSPVSNSGRLKNVLLEEATASGWNWQVELVQDPDPVLSKSEHVVATADSEILNRCDRWINLARLAIERYVPAAYVVDLSDSHPPESLSRFIQQRE